MTQARRNLIRLSDTTYFHMVNRCVRRAFFCGEDRQTGRSYEHRRQWIGDKIKTLSALFSIDVCAYAIMANHYHIVLHVNQKHSLGWDDEEVVRRWTWLFKGVLLVDRYMAGQCGTQAEADRALEVIGQWRERLSDISWFMRCLNEHIAREANREDGCKGRFWEGRYKSQALLDEKALLACMAYVDLNPIRAGLSETLEESAFTSIQERIRWYLESRDNGPEASASSFSDSTPAVSSASPKGQEGCRFDVSMVSLLAFTGTGEKVDGGLPFHFSDYLELVDWTGRAVRSDKRGFIPGVCRRSCPVSEYWGQYT